MVDYIQLYFILCMIIAFCKFYTNFMVIFFDTSDNINPNICLCKINKREFEDLDQAIWYFQFIIYWQNKTTFNWKLFSIYVKYIELKWTLIFMIWNKHSLKLTIWFFMYNIFKYRCALVDP